MELSGVMQFDDLIIHEENIQEEAVDLVLKLRPQWKKDEIKVTVFTDGISNKLVGCCLKTDLAKDDLVLVRVYGQNSELLVDRKAELKTLAMMHAVGCSEPLYATFKNGLSYGFVQGHCLHEENVRDEHIAKLIAREMVTLHSVNPAEILPGVDLGETHTKSRSIVFIKLERWLEYLKENPSPDEALPSVDALRAELKMLEKELLQLNSPLVFSHNDLLLKNIVYNKEKDRTFFIDYELSGFNHQAYDIASHFCEYAGVQEVNYDLYPTKEFQLKWLRNFLQYKFENDGKSKDDVSDLDVERLFVQVDKFKLAAHFFCGVWGMVQSRVSSIDFNYTEYAHIRLNEYFKQKPASFALISL
ncbi:hypothetical protein CAPTEDRAFT_216393 [Capitella teleta]|uniref:ethanolamine kinase n=1 Tax=Capitella teleta TaxID=283909 RepID=R7VK69_CAPTE|nr:hypothetical protein CAPTEDRAFT_216393 [Capitella teleta]|eukprot:ELU17086.1 hypothetical protein CAPTEDRAFT_216393 [Capitella teleta]